MTYEQSHAETMTSRAMGDKTFALTYDGLFIDVPADGDTGTGILQSAVPVVHKHSLSRRRVSTAFSERCQDTLRLVRLVFRRRTRKRRTSLPKRRTAYMYIHIYDVHELCDVLKAIYGWFEMLNKFPYKLGPYSRYCHSPGDGCVTQME